MHGQGNIPPGAFVVSDPDLLFNGEFHRSGVDLILSKAGREFVLHDYFKGEKRAAIASPDGAHLTGDIVNALTGEVQYSQAAPGAGAAQVIGHVTKLTGSATATRNGVSIILNQGDNVEKGDVVQCGSDSTLGVTFIDGTVFGLSANARMVLNEMVYDPNGSSNSSLLSLVAGTITFVAGETAKHGDMKIDTPVATMGIRGTAVLSQIHFIIPQGGGDPQPEADFQVLVEPDGTTGSYILFDKTTLLPIATVNQAGQQIHISGGNVTVSNALLSPEVQKLIQDVFSLKFTENSNNTKLTNNFTDTITPDNNGLVIKTAAGDVAIPTFVNVVPAGSPTLPNFPNGPFITGLFRVPGPPQAVVTDFSGNPTSAFSAAELASKTGDGVDFHTVTGGVNFLDYNLADRPTVQVNFNSFTYQNANSQDVTATLSSLQLADIAASEVNIGIVPDPNNNNNGRVIWTYSVVDKAFDFLAAGETLTLTYMVRVDNNFPAGNETAFVPITITVTGTNDAPVITTGVQNVALSSGTSATRAANGQTSGILTFTDADLTDTHKVSVALKSADLPEGSVPTGSLAMLENALSAAIATDSTGTGIGTVNWKLADLSADMDDLVPKGETLTLTYAVTVTDSQGATSTQTIVVTVSNPAEVWIASGQSPSGGFWKDGVNWQTGHAPTINDDTIIITDPAHGLTPTFPVVIDQSYSASAKSVTMNDLGSTAPVLINLGTLTIAADLDLNADSIVQNSGLITIGGKAEIVDQSVLENCGTVILAAGGDFKDQSTITNEAGGTIEVSGGALNVFVDIDNRGLIEVDPGAMLVLDSATISGGTITIVGELDLDGTSFVTDGTLNNSGAVNVNGSAALHDESVENTGTIEVLAGGALTIDRWSSVDNAGGHVTVDGMGTLTLNRARIAGGTVTNNGEIDLTGIAVLAHGVLVNAGQIDVSGWANVLDAETVTNSGAGAIDITGALTLRDAASITNGASNGETVAHWATLTLGGASSISGGVLVNLGNVFVEGFAGARLDGVNVDNSGGTIRIDAAIRPAELILEGGTAITNGTLLVGWVGTLDVSGALGATLYGVTVDVGWLGVIQVESGSQLVLNNTTINGGTVTNNGVIDVAGDSAIDGAVLRHGQVTIESGKTLTLDDTTVSGTTITNAGTLWVDAHDLLRLAAVTINGGTLGGPGTIDVVSASTINGATLNNAAVTADAKLTLDNATVSGTTITDHAGVELDGTVRLTGGATIQGGPVTNLGLLEVSGTATLLNDTLTNAGHTVQVDSAQTLNLDNSSIIGGTLIINGTLDSSGSSFITGATINNVANIEVSGGTLTIDPTPVINTGTILVTNDSTLVLSDEVLTNSVAGTKGTIQVDATDSTHFSTLDLEGSTIDGGVIKIAGLLTSSGGSFIIGAAITNTGTIDVTSGVLTIDATSTLTNSGLIEADGGKLIVDAAISGNIEIKGASTAELAANESTYSQVIVTFGPGSTGTLVLDQAAPITGNSGLTVVGLDDNFIDLRNVGYSPKTTVSYAGDAAGGILSVYVNGSDVADIKLTGDYLGVHWVLADDGSSQHGTTITEAPGVISGLDADGNAAQDVTLTVSVTDGGHPVTGNVTYNWLVSSDGQHWAEANGVNGGASYTPVEADEGKLLKVDLSFTEGTTTETSTLLAGTVQDNPCGDLVATLDADSAQEGKTIHVTGVTDGGKTVWKGLSYAWQVSSDGGQHWTTVGDNSSYRPQEDDEGKLLQLVVTYKDGTDSESATYGLGTVQDSETSDLVAILDSNTAQRGQTIHVTEVTDGGHEVWTGLSYAWQVSSDGGQHWTTVGTNSSYTPDGSDVGDLLHVVVTYHDHSGSTERTTDSLGTVSSIKEWKGGSHDWNVAGQWSPSGVPGASDDVLVDASGKYTLTIDHAFVAHSLVVDASRATVEIQDDGKLTLGGDLTISDGTFQVDSGGILKFTALSATITGSFTDKGTVEAGGGTLEIVSSSVSGSGIFKIDAHATLQLDHGSGHDVVFGGSGTLVLEDPAHFTGTISDSSGSMTADDVIDLAGFDTNAHVSYSGNKWGGVIKIAEAGHATAEIQVGANSTHWSAPVSDGHGGILIHDPPDDGSAPSAGYSELFSAMGLKGNNSFAFNAPTGRGAAADHGSITDLIQMGQATLANAAPWAVAGDHEHGNTVVPVDTNDATNLHNMLKLQLASHHSDFHFI